jgi:YidC/Oxa1 family membrane protein insertase
MDVRRSIIFVGLAIVSYMLILAWNDDYGQAPVQPAASSVYPTSIIESSSELTQRVESTEFTHKIESTEFTTPEESEDVSSEMTSLKTSDAAIPFQKSISIKTDVLDLIIDLKGGNVVFAAMPEYKITLGAEQALPLLESNSARHYVVESGLFGKNGFDSSKNGPMPSYTTTSTQYELAENQDELIVDLAFKDSTGVSITKRYQFSRNDYLINVSYIIDNKSEFSWEGNLSGKIVRDNTGDPSQQSSMGMQSFLGMALSSTEKPYEKYNFDDMTEEPINQQIQGGWVSFIQHYFLSSWIPNNEITHTYQSKVRNGLFLMGFISPATVVEAGSSGEVSAKLYIGPKIIERLEEVAPNLDLTVDFGWLFFIATPLFLLLDFFYGLVQNWGIAIILVTLVVKALFFKLSAASYRSMANMRRVAPKLKTLKEQHGDDRQKMSAAMMDLYKKEKINPLGGCLPILVQMPVFIALYWVLLESVQLRHAPFMFWITDMSVKDPLFILPILMGISMFIQMQLNPAPPDPMQAKIMKIMPIMMTVFFLWFPAGLVLYWLVNNILSISQQWVITRQIEKANA